MTESQIKLFPLLNLKMEQARVSPLITDQYQISMAYSYFLTGTHNQKATFEMFFRTNPFKGEYAIFAGIGQALEYIANFGFTEQEIKFIKSTLPNADPQFFDYLKTLKYDQLEVRAPLEGQLVFAHEPILQISGPLAFVQLLETTLLALLNYPTLVATNAARFRIAVHPELSAVQKVTDFSIERALQTKSLMEFGLRRAQGINGGIAGSKYAMMGGFNCTSNVECARLNGTMPAGTVAHSFVMSFSDKLEDFAQGQGKVKLGAGFEEFAQCCLKWKQILFKVHERSTTSESSTQNQVNSMTSSHFPMFPPYAANESELTAFAVFGYTQPLNFLVIIDTYEIIESGLYNYIIVSCALIEDGYMPKGIRIDSGDLSYYSKQVRDILDKLNKAMQTDFQVLCQKPYNNQFATSKICVSNDITEDILIQLEKDKAPIDSFGIGTHLVTCKLQPALGGVYKLVEIEGKPKIKLSADSSKTTFSGRKEIYRLYLKNGEPYDDLICTPDEPVPQVDDIITCVHPYDELVRVKVVPARVERLFVDYIKDGKLNYPHEIEKDGKIILKHKSIASIRNFVMKNLYWLRNDHKRYLNPTPYKVSISETLNVQQRKIALEQKTVPLIQ